MSPRVLKWYCTLYGSRKSHRRLLEILRGREISKAKVFKGKNETRFEFPDGVDRGGGGGGLLFISKGKENGING